MPTPSSRFNSAALAKEYFAELASELSKLHPEKKRKFLVPNLGKMLSHQFKKSRDRSSRIGKPHKPSSDIVVKNGFESITIKLRTPEDDKKTRDIYISMPNGNNHLKVKVSERVQPNSLSSEEVKSETFEHIFDRKYLPPKEAAIRISEFAEKELIQTNPTARKAKNEQFFGLNLE